MSSSSSLALLQAAGAAIYEAQQSVEQDFKNISARLQATLLATPYGANTEQAIADMKSMAQIVHEMKSVEEAMRKIYRQAEGLSTDSGVTGHVHAPRQVSYTPSEEPTDVSPKPKKLSPNATKLLGYLRGALSTKEARSLTHADMIKGSGLPGGSLTASIKALVEEQYIIVVERGIYRLAK